MAMSGYEPAPLAEPDTQSVPGGRRAAVAVAVVAILIVGTLLWKPWDSGGGAPGSPRPSASAPVIAVETFPDVAGSPTFTPHPTPTDGPIGTQNPQVALAPDGLGSVQIDWGNDPFVYCVYGGATSTLTSMIVAQPIIIMSSDPSTPSRLKRVTYRPEIEANSLESVFSAEWSFVTAGRTQRWSLGEESAFGDPQQVAVKLDDLSKSAVVRVAVVVNWIGAKGKKLASQRLHPTIYAPLGDNEVDPVPEGCPVHT